MTVNVTFTVDTSRLNRILRNLGKNANKAVRHVAFMVEEQAKINVTEKDIVDTGALRASIYTTVKGHDGYAKASGDVKALNPDATTGALPAPDDLAAHVGPSVEYALYHEFGTVKMSARPYLEPAVATVANRLESDPSILREVVEG